MRILIDFWVFIVLTALLSFTIMSLLIVYKAYFELKNMLKGMEKSDRNKE